MRIALRLTAVVLVAGLASVANAQRVLVYDENSDDHVAQQACTGLSYTCTVANASNFVTLLTGQPWALVVMDMPSAGPDGDWQTPLATYISAGGHAIQTGWSPADFTTLAAVYEVTLGAWHNPLTLYRWNSSPLFTTPNPVPDPLNWVDDDWSANGFYLTPTGTAVAAAGFTASPTAGQAAIVIGNQGRTIFNGFLFDDYAPADANSDGKQDAVELVQNEMVLAYPPAAAIPTLSGAGLVFLALLIAGLGAALVMRRRLAG